MSRFTLFLFFVLTALSAQSINAAASTHKSTTVKSARSSSSAVGTHHHRHNAILETSQKKKQRNPLVDTNSLRSEYYYSQGNMKKLYSTCLILFLTCCYRRNDTLYLFMEAIVFGGALMRIFVHCLPAHAINCPNTR
mmetsp:Transcript_27334/g.36598  ORF Transcript_27334/g.36598 Transcript_27334/m.36598 type:complete len:137 (+) Transcript_27334:48-458(+)